jgi:hypothetical protein
MARASIADLPLPNSHWRPDKPGCRDPGAKPFETSAQCEAEDTLRAKQLREQADAGSTLIDPVAALTLANKIDPARRPKGKLPPSLSSSSRVRQHRIRTGNIWQRAGEGSELFTTATLMPAKWRYSPEELMGVDARNLVASLRTDWNRAGGMEASGWAIAFLHGEFEPETEKFRLHFHLTATGGMLGVIDRLRDQKKYQRAIGADGNAKGPAPVVIAREALTDPGGNIAYTLKSYWPCMRTGPVGSDGEVRRNTFVSRIPEPFHALALLWLDQWELKDISLLYGVYATKGGLRVSR